MRNDSPAPGWHRDAPDHGRLILVSDRIERGRVVVFVISRSAGRLGVERRDCTAATARHICRAAIDFPPAMWCGLPTLGVVAEAIRRFSALPV